MFPISVDLYWQKGVAVGAMLAQATNIPEEDPFVIITEENFVVAWQVTMHEQLKLKNSQTQISSEARPDSTLQNKKQIHICIWKCISKMHNSHSLSRKHNGFS